MTERTPSSIGLGMTTAAGLIGAVSTLLAGVWVGLLGVGMAVRCEKVHLLELAPGRQPLEPLPLLVGQF